MVFSKMKYISLIIGFVLCFGLVSGESITLTYNKLSTDGEFIYQVGNITIIYQNGTTGSYNETDPVYSSMEQELRTNSSLGQQAYSWGNHALVGYFDNITDFSGVLTNGKFCKYIGTELVCNYDATTNLTGYFNNIENFTGTLTNTKYCVYDQGNNEIDCNAEGGSSGITLSYAENYLLNLTDYEIRMGEINNNITVLGRNMSRYVLISDYNLQNGEINYNISVIQTWQGEVNNNISLIQSWQNEANYNISGKQNYHGIENYGVLSFDNSTHIVQITSVKYWYNGTSYNTLVPVTCDLDDYVTLADGDLYYVYFDDLSGTLKASESFWNLYSKVPLATVFWNGTRGVLVDELHGYRRNIAWHIWAHLTIGARYYSGLDLIYPSTTTDNDLDLTLGYLYDEDLLESLSHTSSAYIFYQKSAGVYTFRESNLPYAGIDGTPQYLDTDTYTLTDIGAAKFAPMWVYAGEGVNSSIYIIPHQGSTSYNTIGEARSSTPPNLQGLAINPELKLIYRFIYKGDGNFQESTDYRLSQALGGSGSTVTSAASVIYTAGGTISSTNVQSAIEELDTENQAWHGEANGNISELQAHDREDNYNYTQLNSSIESIKVWEGEVNYNYSYLNNSIEARYDKTTIDAWQGEANNNISTLQAQDRENNYNYTQLNSSIELIQLWENEANYNITQLQNWQGEVNYNITEIQAWENEMSGNLSNYHPKNADLVVGEYDVTVGGGYSNGGDGVTIYKNGSIFLTDDILLGGDFLTVQTTMMNGSFYPSATNIYNLGRNESRWNGIYVNNIWLGNNRTGAINFYESNIYNNEQIYWDSDNDQFIFTDDINSEGNDIISLGTIRGGDLDISDDVKIGDTLYLAGNLYSVYSYTDITNSQLRAYATGKLFANSSVYTIELNATNQSLTGDLYLGNSEANHYIYFYEDSATKGEQFYWDNTGDQFYFTDTVAVTESLYSGGDIWTTGAGDDLMLGSPSWSNSQMRLLATGGLYANLSVYTIELNATNFTIGTLNSNEIQSNLSYLYANAVLNVGEINYNITQLNSSVEAIQLWENEAGYNITALNNSVESRAEKVDPRLSGNGNFDTLQGNELNVTNASLSYGLRLAAEPAADTTISGTFIYANTDRDFTFGQIAYMNVSGNMEETDADFYNMTQGLMGMAAESCAKGEPCKFMLQGMARNDAWSWRAGDSLYVDTTAATLTRTIPSTSGDFVRIPCHAYSDDAIYCNFDNTVVEI